MKRLIKLSIIVIFALINAGAFTACFGGGIKTPGTHEHVAGEWKTTIATACELTGTREKRCTNTRCNAVLDTEEIPALGHNPGEWETIPERDCVARVKRCTRCRKTLETDGTADHVLGEYTVTATCAQAGTGTGACSRCGKTATIPITALGHDWQVWVITNKPTCTEAGLETRGCARCGIDETRSVAALGHAWKWVATTPATVTADGEETYTCSHCGLTDGTRVLHAVGTEGLYYYLINYNTEYGVSAGSASGDIYIPAYHKGLPVTAVGLQQFFMYENLTSVTMSGNLKNIGDFAFYRCENLKSVTIPAGVTNIGYGAFTSCIKLENITVEEGNTVYRSEDNCLLENNTLKLGCKNSIIPDGVTIIGDKAFEYCIGLESVTIPESVNEIGAQAFSGCTNLKSVVFENGSKLTIIAGMAFSCCESLERISIPENVSFIGREAFNYCLSLESIKIPPYVTFIAESAFASCSKLTSVIFPYNSRLEKIEDYAFYYCENLSFVIIPPQVSWIDVRAFTGCGKLATVFYRGANSSDWESILIFDYNEPLTNAKRYYFSYAEPVEYGDYWCLGEDGLPAIWL